MPDTEAASARRNWYLASLGIVRYVPREEMVSAEGSLRDESLHGEPLHREPLRESTPREDASPQGMTDGVAAVESVRQALGGAGPATVGSAPAERRDRGRPRLDLGDPAPATAVATPAGVPATEPAAEPFLCRIGFWQPASRVAVLSAMPPGQRPTPVQITMLTNLLKAIGALGQGLPPVDLIDWPPSSGLGMQGGAGLAAARDYLGVFLQTKQRLQNFEAVLLMGDVAARVCGDDDTFAAGRQLELPWGARGIVTHSLHAMEQTPALKAETWQAIRFLAG